MVKKEEDEKDQMKTNEEKKIEKERKVKGKPKVKKEEQEEQTQLIPRGDSFQNIDTAIIQFFSSIDQTNLVFQQKTRSQLQKLYPLRGITPSPEYDAKVESIKIGSNIAKLAIVKYLQSKDIKDSKLVQQLQSFFQQASKFFASEVTSELYNILSKTCDIVFENRKDKEKRKQQLRKFGDSIPSAEMEKQYFYFGFHMFKLPRHKKQSDINNMRKHYPHYKYLLLQKYRKPEGPYANFIEKIGRFVLKIMKESSSQKILFG